MVFNALHRAGSAHLSARVMGSTLNARRLSRFTVALALLFGASVITHTASAQAPTNTGARGQRAIGDTVADHPSSVYRFERHMLDSADGKRHYRVEIAIPAAPAPESGFPVLYMLDGNSAMATLTDDDLAMLARTRPAVLVAIGYDVDTRNDVVSRAYDYTPPEYDKDNGKLAAPPVVRGRVGGGADVFLALIQSRIMPLVQARANVNPKQAYLWGHSYGGLFTLHTLFTQPDAFARYIVGDPSAWWNDGALVNEWQAFQADRAAGKRIGIFVGTKPRDTPRPMSPPAAAATPDGTARNAQATGNTTPQATPADQRAAVADMAEGLRAGGASVSYETFPQYGHGEMIRASLERALQIVTEP
ncbi:alpha/beta hydrolase-fold protein [Alcaligenaceae bacterium B3P038]|nr:alpha/beta hydrolase-fold protein [Alcaligenaceae bacterium B3P038]